jgi:hypothetical protein
VGASQRKYQHCGLLQPKSGQLSSGKLPNESRIRFSPDSRLISDFPEFRDKHFEILWRGSRDGSKAKEFHYPCDRHRKHSDSDFAHEWEHRQRAAPMKLESNSDCKADDSLKSFLFTLKNPHSFLEQFPNMEQDFRGPMPICRRTFFCPPPKTELSARLRRIWFRIEDPHL